LLTRGFGKLGVVEPDAQVVLRLLREFKRDFRRLGGPDPGGSAVEIAAGGVKRSGLGNEAVIGAVGPIAGMSGGERAGGEQSPLPRLYRLAGGDVGGGDLSAIRGEGGRVEELLGQTCEFVPRFPW